MCRVVSWMVRRGYLLWPVYSFCKTLLAFFLLHFVLHGHMCLLLQVSLDFLLLHSCFLWWKGHIFLVLILEGLVGHHRPFNFSFFSIPGWGIDLDYWDSEWSALERNRGHSVICTQVQRSNCQHPLDHGKSKRVPEKHLCFIDYAKAFDCVDHNKLENSERDGNTRPPDLPLEKFVCRSGSNS